MTTLGWRPRGWTWKVRCVCCRALVKNGVTHVNDNNDPPVRAMCQLCYNEIMGSSSQHPFFDKVSQQ